MYCLLLSYYLLKCTLSFTLTFICAHVHVRTALYILSYVRTYLRILTILMYMYIHHMYVYVCICVCVFVCTTWTCRHGRYYYMYACRVPSQMCPQVFGTCVRRRSFDTLSAFMSIWSPLAWISLLTQFSWLHDALSLVCLPQTCNSKPWKPDLALSYLSLFFRSF